MQTREGRPPFFLFEGCFCLPVYRNSFSLFYAHRHYHRVA
ncbi:hypothetical protein EVA_21718 [gut metagenome]|uniref:Uncharacterized protein n=1 Tax=gut metagenome TaxID=749906 RepID=J9FS40_9ZZZZ